jgi:hypothetical protein
MMHETNAIALLMRLQNFVPQPSTKVLDALAAKTLLP